jgi:adenosylhomocysteine nucleosidase
MKTAHPPRTSTGGNAPFAVFVATQAEMKPIATSLQPTRQSAHRSDEIVRVGIKGRDFLLARTGVGPDNAATVARRLFEETPIAAALSLGVAGGLSPQLRTGDLIVGDRTILQRDSRQVLYEEKASRLENFPCDSGLQDAAVTVIRRWDSRYWVGPILTVGRIVLTAEEKRHLAAESGAIALDMESAAIASAASACSVPFLAIRGVLDPIHEDLGAGFDQFLDERGEPQLLALIRYLMTHPSTLPHLVRLGLRTKAICAHFGPLVQELSTALR